MNPIRLSIILILTTIVYSFGQLLWYWGTPLGQSPVLDGLENLVTAQKIATGNLAHEPFYRAMLYPAFLSVFLFLGLGESSLPLLTGFIGVILHVIVTALSLRLSWVLWKSGIALAITGTLVGLNPVFIHFALDPLDIALGTALFLGGICLLKEVDPLRISTLSRIGSGVLLGLAPLTRPHLFAPFVVIALILFGVCVWKRSGWKSFCWIGAGGALPLLLYGIVQLSWGNSFGVLPWQGAYNLWASNKPEANGLYLKQSVFIHDLGEHRNPTRVESEILYEQETGDKGTIAEQSTYWRSKTIRSVLDNPIQWLELIAWKSYALVNNYEQYNNKTFSFHKSRSPWLRFNPVSAGILLVLGAIGLIVLWRRNRSLAMALIAIIGAYGGGLIIYMVSGRFRAPMIPLLAVLSGGASCVPILWRQLSKNERVMLSIIPLVLLLLSFSKFGGIDSRVTEVQDRMLLADASAKLGRDREAIEWANQVYQLNPTREDAFRIILISYYNLVTSGQEVDGDWAQFKSHIDGIRLSDPIFDYVRGIAYWNIGKTDFAKRVWGSSLQKHGWSGSSNLGALLWIDPGMKGPELSDELVNEIRLGNHSVLATALCRRDVRYIREFGMSDEVFARRELAVSRAFKGVTITR